MFAKLGFLFFADGNGGVKYRSGISYRIRSDQQKQQHQYPINQTTTACHAHHHDMKGSKQLTSLPTRNGESYI